MLSKFKRNKHQQHLAQLPKLPQPVDAVQTLYSATDFRTTLLEVIANATQRIYLVALYLENDDGGRDVLSALYAAKRQRPELEVCVLVDWHRAQRGRIGAARTRCRRKGRTIAAKSVCGWRCLSGWSPPARCAERGLRRDHAG